MKNLICWAFIAIAAVSMTPGQSQAQLWRFRPYQYPDQSFGYLGPLYQDSVWYSPEYWRYHSLFEPRPAAAFYSGTTSLGRAGAPSSTAVLSSRSRIDSDRIGLHVLVPNPDASVWIGDHLMRQTGPQRDYLSQPLREGEPYYYTVRAVWNEDGQEVERERRVRAIPGRWFTVDFGKGDYRTRTLRATTSAR